MVTISAFVGIIDRFLTKDIVLLGAAIYFTGVWLARFKPHRGVERAA